MNSTNKSLSLAVAGALALSVGATSVNAASNPFAIKSLSSGYQVADAGTDTGAGTTLKDGKCSTGKCGADKKKAKLEKEMKARMAEGKCNAEMKTKDGSCSAEMKKEMSEKAVESKNNADMKKTTDGK